MIVAPVVSPSIPRSRSLNELRGELRGELLACSGNSEFHSQLLRESRDRLSLALLSCTMITALFDFSALPPLSAIPSKISMAI
jgi:hypothetical protein